jgi:hypothetical protein
LETTRSAPADNAKAHPTTSSYIVKRTIGNRGIMARTSDAASTPSMRGKGAPESKELRNRDVDSLRQSFWGQELTLDRDAKPQNGRLCAARAFESPFISSAVMLADLGAGTCKQVK